MVNIWPYFVFQVIKRLLERSNCFRPYISRWTDDEYLALLCVSGDQETVGEV